MHYAPFYCKLVEKSPTPSENKVTLVLNQKGSVHPGTQTQSAWIELCHSTAYDSTRALKNLTFCIRDSETRQFGRIS